MTVTQKLSTSTAYGLKFFMSFQSLRLALVPVGDTGTIPFSMRKETCDFPGASRDSKKDACDGNRWWYINSTAMKWATSQ